MTLIGEAVFCDGCLEIKQINKSAEVLKGFSFVSDLRISTRECLESARLSQDK